MEFIASMYYVDATNSSNLLGDEYKECSTQNNYDGI